MADIARVQGLEQKPLYRRIKKICKEWKKALEREGVRREDVKGILGCLQTDLVARPKKKGCISQFVSVVTAGADRGGLRKWLNLHL